MAPGAKVFQSRESEYWGFGRAGQPSVFGGNGLNLQVGMKTPWRATEPTLPTCRKAQHLVCEPVDLLISVAVNEGVPVYIVVAGSGLRFAERGDMRSRARQITGDARGYVIPHCNTVNRQDALPVIE
jgi:hypothetical protein